MVLPELEEEFEENKKLSLTSLLLEPSHIATRIGLGGLDILPRCSVTSNNSTTRRGGDVRMNDSPLGYGRNGRNGSTAVTY